MDADLRKHLVDMQNHASAMSKVESGQKRLNWYYLALTIDAQLKGAAPIPPPPPVTVGGKVPVLASITTPTITTGAQAWPPVGSIQINPGDSWQAKVNANPVGTVFAIMPGTHTNATVQPKNNNQFLGSPGVNGTYGPTGLTSIMDGAAVTKYAVDAHNATGVTVANLEIKNYRPDGQYGCIEQTNNHGYTSANWLIYNVDVHHSGYGGIGIGTGTLCRNSRSHHNAYMGFSSAYSTGATFRNCEFDNNHTAGDDPYIEASAGKVAVTTGLVFDGNWSHDNNGAGCWYDIDNYQAEIKNNLFERNVGPGVFYEISWDFLIHDNTFHGNGTQNAGWLWNSAIQIAASGSPAGHPASEVYNNTLVGDRYGIWLFQQSRGTGTYGNHYTQNVHVHHNTTTAGGTLNGGGQGFSQDVGDTAIATSRGNTWDYNTYHSPFTFPGPFVMAGVGGLYDGRTFAEWQAAGNDVHGTYT